MIVAIEKHIERIDLSDSDYYRNRGALKLQELLDSSSPYEDWEALQKQAADDFKLSIKNSTDLLDYTKSSYYLQTVPLFSTAVIYDSIDNNLLKSGIKSIRKNINLLIKELLCGYSSNSPQKERIIGQANELSIFGSMLYPNFLENGLIPLPALPWEDNKKYSPLTYRPNLGETNNKKTEIDLKIYSTQERASIKNIQVKSTRSWDDIKEYDDNIDVIACSDILDFLKNKMYVPDNYRADGLAMFLSSNNYAKPHFKYNLVNNYLFDKLNLSNK